MGYDIYITRDDDWTENRGRESHLEEWERLVEEDPELEIDYCNRLSTEEWERLIQENPELAGRKTASGTFFSSEQNERLKELARELKEGERVDIDVPGFYDTADWKAHPGGERRCFWLHEGNIETKDPDLATLAKMLQLAEKLEAQVQGDDQELYRNTDRGWECYDRQRPHLGWRPLEVYHWGRPAWGARIIREILTSKGSLDRLQ
jgi:hypothetical protein